MAELVTFTYNRATEWTDGTPLALSDIRSTRLYCDGDSTWAAGEPGADGELIANLAAGIHTCYAVHSAFDSNGVVYESDPSNEVIVGEPIELIISAPTDLAVVE